MRATTKKLRAFRDRPDWERDQDDTWVFWVCMFFGFIAIVAAL